jgi:hypothetical protein
MKPNLIIQHDFLFRKALKICTKKVKKKSCDTLSSPQEHNFLTGPRALGSSMAPKGSVKRGTGSAKIIKVKFSTHLNLL